MCPMPNFVHQVYAKPHEFKEETLVPSFLYTTVHELFDRGSDSLGKLAGAAHEASTYGLSIPNVPRVVSMEILFSLRQ